jgi:hypothetical protein
MRKIVYLLSENKFNDAYIVINDNVDLLNTIHPFVADLLIIKLDLILSDNIDIEDVFDKLVAIYYMYEQLNQNEQDVWKDLLLSTFISLFKLNLTDEQEEQILDILVSDASNEYYTNIATNYLNNKEKIDITNVIDAKNDILYEHIRNILNYYVKC